MKAEQLGLIYPFFQMMMYLFPLGILQKPGYLGMMDTFYFRTEEVRLMETKGIYGMTTREEDLFITTERITDSCSLRLYDRQT